MINFHQLCLVTDKNNPLEDEELLFLEALKADDFFAVDVQAWDDPNVDWTKYKTIILRSAWDYTKTLDKFIQWTKVVSARGVEVINSPEAIEWNSNKKYLLDLANAGIPILPTVLIDKSSVDSFVLLESNAGWIVKPTVGGSARGVKRFSLGSEDDLKNYAVQIIDTGVDVLVQPFAEEIMNGEVSFVFFGDQYSHACKKTPDKNDFRVQPEYGGHDRYFDASPDQIAQARAAKDAAPYDLLYVRVDMIEVNGKFILMELEAIEPYLFFGYNQAPQVFISVLKDYISAKNKN